MEDRITAKVKQSFQVWKLCFTQNSKNQWYVFHHNIHDFENWYPNLMGISLVSEHYFPIIQSHVLKSRRFGGIFHFYDLNMRRFVRIAQLYGLNYQLLYKEWSLRLREHHFQLMQTKFIPLLFIAVCVCCITYTMENFNVDINDSPNASSAGSSDFSQEALLELCVVGKLLTDKPVRF